MIKIFAYSAVVMTLALLTGAPLAARPLAPKVELSPHRAIYDLSLQNASASSSVSGLRGRLVLDFSGSPCAGYSYTSRLVTEMTDQDGGSFVTDMRTSTWEDAEGQRFRFENTEYNGFQQTSVVSGSASREGAGAKIAVSLEKPAKGSVEFDRSALFPTQHSIAILDAAQRGERLVQADVYDGSEQGDKLYSTTAFIGQPVLPSEQDEKALDAIDNAAPLKNLKSWPVSISFFDMRQPGERDEGLPTYELSFQLFSNGVSGDLTINYGDFLIGGKLRRLDFNETAECPPAAQ